MGPKIRASATTPPIVIRNVMRTLWTLSRVRKSAAQSSGIWGAAPHGCVSLTLRGPQSLAATSPSLILERDLWSSLEACTTSAAAVTLRSCPLKCEALGLRPTRVPQTIHSRTSGYQFVQPRGQPFWRGNPASRGREAAGLGILKSAVEGCRLIFDEPGYD